MLARTFSILIASALRHAVRVNAQRRRTLSTLRGATPSSQHRAERVHHSGHRVYAFAMASRRTSHTCLFLCIGWALTSIAAGRAATADNKAATATRSLIFLDASSAIDPEAQCVPWILPAEDRCAYVEGHRKVCEEGRNLLPYMRTFYCTLGRWPLLGNALLIAYAGYLLLILMTVADRFFCPALEVVADFWQLPENVAGATLLSFGNAAPDLFTQLATIAEFDPAAVPMAIGEPVGGGLFVSNVVLALVIFFGRSHSGHVQVEKRAFLRDAGFLTAAMALVCLIAWDGKVFVGEAFLLVALYVIFVVYVFVCDRKRTDPMHIEDSRHYQQVCLAAHTSAENAILSSTGGGKSASRSLLDATLDIDTVPVPSRAPRHAERSGPSNTLASGSGSSNQLRLSHVEQTGLHLAVDPSSVARGPMRPAASCASPSGTWHSNTIMPLEKLQPSLRSQLLVDNAAHSGAHGQVSSSAGLQTLASLPNDASARLLKKFVTTDSIVNGARVVTFEVPEETVEVDDPLEPLLGVRADVGSAGDRTIAERTWIAALHEPVIGLLRLTMPEVGMDDNVSYPKPFAVLLPVTAPLFVVLSKRFALRTDAPLNSASLLYGLGCALLASAVIYAIYPRSGKHYGILSGLFTVMTFGMSILWMDVAASEMVRVFKVLGYIHGLNQAMLGVTVLAWANAVGDLIADVAMARDGFPAMAVAASFASPLFSASAGLGLTFTIATLQHGTLNFSMTVPIRIALTFGLLSAARYIILVPTCLNWRLGPRFAYSMLAFYLFFQLLYVWTVLTPGIAGPSTHS